MSLAPKEDPSIPFRIDRFGLLAVQGTFKSLLHIILFMHSWTQCASFCWGFLHPCSQWYWPLNFVCGTSVSLILSWLSCYEVFMTVRSKGQWCQEDRGSELKELSSQIDIQCHSSADDFFLIIEHFRFPSSGWHTWVTCQRSDLTFSGVISPKLAPSPETRFPK